MDAISQDIFKCFFVNENFCILIEISLKFVPKGPSIGLGNSLALNRCQAIIWINADPIHRRIYAALGGDELRHLHLYTEILRGISGGIVEEGSSRIGISGREKLER